METCTWPLGNGESLSFTIYTQDATWNKVAGLYIFAYSDEPKHWVSLYVGQTEDFSSRIPNHERWASALQRGATHVHTLVVPQEANRLLWERMMIQHLRPVLNEQLL